jgi:hypothetical protein
VPKFAFNRRDGILGFLSGILGMNGSMGATTDATRATRPRTLAEALPLQYASTIVDAPKGSGIPGLYLSSYLSWHRVLILGQNGQYRLVLWKIDKDTFARSEAREYTGRYSVTKTEYGDELVELDFRRQELLNGGDACDESLLFMRSGGDRYLIRPMDLNQTAFDIRENGTLGQSDAYLFDASLTTHFGEEPYQGRPSPPVEALPRQLARLVTAEPLVMMITAVDELPDTGGFSENQRVMCTLSLGESDGLYMNMPIYSPAESGKQLEGHVWVLRPTNCRAGVRYEIDAGGAVIEMPQVGDILTSKAPR